MELRQLRYFVRVVELGSMGRAAADLGVVTSALSQQISRLESELATRLLVRSSTGVEPTDAGLAFLHAAQLTLRHADDAVRVAQQARLAGQVSVGLAPTTASVLGLPLMQRLRERYPDVRLHLVESLSGHLASMLNARQLDLAVLFQTDSARRWSVTPLLHERLFLIRSPALAVPGADPGDHAAAPAGQREGGSDDRREGSRIGQLRQVRQVRRIRLSGLGEMALILPSGPHGLRSTLDRAFAAAGIDPLIVAEIDSLVLLMDAVRAGHGATVQPGAAIARLDPKDFVVQEIADRNATRQNLLVSVSDDELSPAALAVRVTMVEVARNLVQSGHWPGATLHES